MIASPGSSLLTDVTPPRSSGTTARPWFVLFANGALVSAILGVALVLVGWTLKLSPALTSGDAALGAAVRSVLPPSFRDVAQVIAALCGLPGAAVVLAAVVAGVLIVRSSLDDALTAGMLIAGGCVACWIVKALVQRPAPGVPTGLDSTGQSFPSGHVAFATSVAVTLWLLVRHTRWTIPAAAGLALVVLLVAASRIDLDVHYPTDTVAGTVVALGGVALTGASLHAARRRLGVRVAPLDRQESRP